MSPVKMVNAAGVMLALGSAFWLAMPGEGDIKYTCINIAARRTAAGACERTDGVHDGIGEVPWCIAFECSKARGRKE